MVVGETGSYMADWTQSEGLAEHMCICAQNFERRDGVEEIVEWSFLMWGSFLLPPFMSLSSEHMCPLAKLRKNNKVLAQET